MNKGLRLLSADFNKRIKAKDRKGFNAFFASRIDKEVLFSCIGASLETIKDKEIVAWIFEEAKKININLSDPLDGWTTLLHKMPEVKKDVALEFIDQWHASGFPMDPIIENKNTPLGRYLESTNEHKIHIEVVERFIKYGANINADHMALKKWDGGIDDIARFDRTMAEDCTSAWTYLFGALSKENISVIDFVLSSPFFLKNIDNVLINISMVTLSGATYRTKMDVPQYISYVINKQIDQFRGETDLIWGLFEFLSNDGKKSVLRNSGRCVLGMHSTTMPTLSRKGGKMLEAFLESNNWICVEMENIFFSVGRWLKPYNSSVNNECKLALKFMSKQIDSKRSSTFRYGEVRDAVFECCPDVKGLLIDAIGEVDVYLAFKKLFSQKKRGNGGLLDVATWDVATAKYWVKKLKKQMANKNIDEFDLTCLNDVHSRHLCILEPILKEMCNVGVCKYKNVLSIMERVELSEQILKSPYFEDLSRFYRDMLNSWGRLSLIEDGAMIVSEKKRDVAL